VGPGTVPRVPAWHRHGQVSGAAHLPESESAPRKHRVAGRHSMHGEQAPLGPRFSTPSHRPAATTYGWTSSKAAVAEQPPGIGVFSETSPFRLQRAELGCFPSPPVPVWLSLWEPLMACIDSAINTCRLLSSLPPTQICAENRGRRPPPGTLMLREACTAFSTPTPGGASSLHRREVNRAPPRRAALQSSNSSGVDQYPLWQDRRCSQGEGPEGLC
jgi:hypothetical protein